MKKHIILFAAFFAALLLVPGCDPNENVELNTKGLTISLFSDEPETKADETTFETKITHFDYFFFTDENGTSTDGPIYQGRVTGSSKTFETGLGKDFVNLRKVTSFLYVIANYPTTIDHTKKWTLAELKALPVEAELVKSIDSETGAATFCSDMVMDSYSKTTTKYTVELTPALVEEVRTVNVGLTRIASKLVLNFTIPESVTGSMTGEGEVWTPVLKDLRAYYVNALNNRSTVGATPVQRSAIPEADVDDYQYFSYPTNYPISPDPLTATPTSSNYEFTTGEVYTYPQTWTAGENGEPYFKIQMTWRSSIRGTSNFYYKICVPKPATDGTVTIDRNTCYVVDVTLNVIDTENEYVVVDPANYTVQEWAVSAWKGGGGLASARFFNVPKKAFTLYSEESVAIPFSSSSEVTAVITEISYKYYGDTNGDTFEYVFQDGAFNKTEADGKTTITLKTTDSNGRTVATPARETNAYEVSVEGKFVNFTHTLTKIYTERVIKITISNTEGRSAQVVINQHPAIELKKHETKNMFVNGWFARATKPVHDGDGNLLGQRFGPTNFFDTGWYPYHCTESWNGNRIDNTSARGNLGTIYGNGTSNVTANSVYTTEITVSAFNEDNNSFVIEYRNATTYNGGTATRHTRNYRIGDPRVPASNHYTASEFSIPNYLYSDKTHRDADDTESTVSTGNVYRAWEKPMEILIANQGVDANEVIAPRFLVSSALNIMSSGLTHLQSARRAATYQEDGYPAGRWRLPTEAEIAFIVARQKEGALPWLFAETYYHCANGRMVYVRMGDSYKNDPPISVNPTNGYNRFVYDLWYWGDGKMDDTMYHPNMHEHTNN